MKALYVSSKQPFTAIGAAIFTAGLVCTLNTNAQRVSADKASQSIELNEPKAETTWMRSELFYGGGRLPTTTQSTPAGITISIILSLLDFRKDSLYSKGQDSGA